MSWALPLLGTGQAWQAGVLRVAWRRLLSPQLCLPSQTPPFQLQENLFCLPAGETFPPAQAPQHPAWDGGRACGWRLTWHHGAYFLQAGCCLPACCERGTSCLGCLYMPVYIAPANLELSTPAFSVLCWDRHACSDT